MEAHPVLFNIPVHDMDKEEEEIFGWHNIQEDD